MWIDEQRAQLIISDNLQHIVVDLRTMEEVSQRQKTLDELKL